jgi:hypothetical protein
MQNQQIDVTGWQPVAARVIMACRFMMNVQHNDTSECYKNLNLNTESDDFAEKKTAKSALVPDTEPAATADFESGNNGRTNYN